MQVRAAEISAVDKEILVAQSLSCGIRTAGEAIDAYHGSLCLYIDNLICDIGSKHILYPEFQGLGRSQDIYILAIVGEGESDIRTCEGYADELRDDMLELDIIRLEELASCRHIVEEIAYAEVGSSRRRYLIGGYMLRICKIHLAAHLIVFPTGLERDLGHCCDGCQSLSSEAESQDIVQVLCCLKLGCRVSLETEDGLVRRHSASVVDDLDESPAGILDHDGNLIRSCIHSILHQLLHHGCRPLHDLSRGDHIRYIAW